MIPILMQKPSKRVEIYNTLSFKIYVIIQSYSALERNKTKEGELLTVHKKLTFHLEEATIHIDRLSDILPVLEDMYPLDKKTINILSSEDKDKLDVLAFRFAKLQDLIGVKIFREYLSALHYPVEDKNFLELLKELDKENIVDIDIWSELRGVRNSISHDYPFEEDERLEAINYLIKNVSYLIDITKNIKDNLETIRQRD